MNTKATLERVHPDAIKEIITRLVAGFEYYRHLYDENGVIKFKYLGLCNDYRSDTISVTDSEGGSLFGYNGSEIEGEDSLDYNMNKLISMLFRGHNYASKKGIPKNTDIETLKKLITEIWNSEPNPGPRPSEEEMVNVIEESKTEYQKGQNPFAAIEEALRKNNMID